MARLVWNKSTTGICYIMLKGLDRCNLALDDAESSITIEKLDKDR